MAGTLLLLALLTFPGCKGKAARADDLAQAGIVAGRAGDLSGALASFDQALALDPDNLKALYNSGLALLGAGKGDEAAARFDHFNTLRPDDPLGYFYLGRASLRAGDQERAVASLKRAVELGFDDWVEWKAARDLGALAGDFRFSQLELVVAQRAGGQVEPPRGGQGYGGRAMPHAPFPALRRQQACNAGSAVVDGVPPPGTEAHAAACE